MCWCTGRPYTTHLLLTSLPPCVSAACRGEGMPISKYPGTKGNLLIKFDVVFPRNLSESQKQQIRAALPAR